MLITFITSFTIAFAILYYAQAKRTKAFGYRVGISMLQTNSVYQVRGYIDKLESYSSFNFWYKAGIKKAIVKYKQSYIHDHS